MSEILTNNMEGFLSKGKAVEACFHGLKEKQGCIMSVANNQEDMKEHWDVMYNGRKVDVKGMKGLIRYDPLNENYHHVELRNINGQLGWLFGNADEFAFETEDFFVIVEAQILRNLIKSKLKCKVCSFPTPYELYHRKGTKDVITLSKTIDLINISKEILYK